MLGTTTMSNDLVVMGPSSGAIAERGISGAMLMQRWLAGRSASTIAGYTADLKAFAEWLATHLNDWRPWANAEPVDGARIAINPGLALDVLLTGGQGNANATAHAWRASMLEDEPRVSPATINRRLAALRSIVKIAKVFGLIAWDLTVDSVKAESYRDTLGPSPEQVRQIIEHAASHPFKPKAARDVALIMLLYGNGLRVSECTELDLERFQLRPRPRLSIRGKGRLEREWVSLAPPTLKALQAWLAHRGLRDGPLFLRLHTHGGKTVVGAERLTRDGIGNMLEGWGAALGFRLTPHGLRHAHVTQVLEASNGNIRLANKSARHRKIETTVKYDDNRQDLAGAASRLAAGLVGDLIDRIDEEASA